MRVLIACEYSGAVRDAVAALGHEAWSCDLLPNETPGLRKPDQIIQPWQFGHPESKATCLWLKGLPPLLHTNVLPKPVSGRWDNQTASGQNKLPPSPDRWKERSRTYAGIAKAIAEQWCPANP